MPGTARARSESWMPRTEEASGAGLHGTTGGRRGPRAGRSISILIETPPKKIVFVAGKVLNCHVGRRYGCRRNSNGSKRKRKWRIKEFCPKCCPPRRRLPNGRRSRKYRCSVRTCQQECVKKCNLEKENLINSYPFSNEM